MSDTKNFWKGILLGALAGGALSLLDKPTRHAVTKSIQNTSTQVGHVLKDPSVLVEKVKATSAQMRETARQVSDDVTFIKEKVEELTEVTPQVMDMVKETKDSFSKGGHTYVESTSESNLD